MTMSLYVGGLALMGDSASPYRAMLSGADMGTPEPITSATRSLFTDGSVVSGKYTDNRTIALTVLVSTSSAIATGRAVDLLAAAVDRTSFPVDFTPASGLPVVYDCFRGWAGEDYSWEGRTDTRRRVRVEIPAMPFPRTARPVNVANNKSVAFVSIQDFEGTMPYWTGSNRSSTQFTQGTDAAGDHYGFTYGSSGPYNATVRGPVWWQVNQTGLNINISNYEGQVVQFGYWDNAWLDDVTWNYFARWLTQSFTLTLTTSVGSATWTVPSPLRMMPRGVGAIWQWVAFNLAVPPDSTTGSGPMLTSHNLTAYTLRMDGVLDTVSSAQGGVEFAINNLQAAVGGPILASNKVATLFGLTAVQGTARTAAMIRLSGPSTTGMVDCLLYSVPPEANLGYNPIMPTSGGSTPQGIAYDGTYTVVGSISEASRGGSVSCSVTIQQRSYTTNIGTAWTASASTTAGDSYVILGEVTLPIVGLDKISTEVNYLITYSGAEFIFLLDTRGALVLLGIPSLTLGTQLAVTEPDPATGVGDLITGTSYDPRPVGYSVMGKARMSGGPFVLYPGQTNKILWVNTHCSIASDMMGVVYDYSPRWMTERAY